MLIAKLHELKFISHMIVVLAFAHVLLLISGSSTIKVKDEQTGTVHLVGSHYVSSACGLIGYWSIVLLFLSMLLHNLVY